MQFFCYSMPKSTVHLKNCNFTTKMEKNEFLFFIIFLLFFVELDQLVGESLENKPKKALYVKKQI